MADESITSRRGLLLLYAVVLCGTAIVCASLWQVASETLSLTFLALLTLTILVGWLAVRVPTMPISFSISDTFSIASAVLVGPSAGALTAATDGLILSFRMRRSARTLPRVLFNLAAPAVAVWIAGHAFRALGGPEVFVDSLWRVPRLMALLLVFGVLNFGISTTLVAAAVGLELRTPPLTVWREHFVGLWVTHLGGTLAAMLMLVLSHNLGAHPLHPVEVMLLIVPVPVILYVNFQHAVGRTQDQMDHLAGMNRVYMATIEALAQTIDAKDQVTHDHIRRVQENSVRLARAVGIESDAELQALKAAALLHDVGKISVPDHILNKPGPLSPSELEIMRRHAPAGADILSVIGFPYPVVPIVRHHHENWDGSGYPDGLAGEAIPIGARILMVVDCFDALTSDRPYRPRFDTSAALQLIVDRRGTMYDPRVVDAFLALHDAGLNELPPDTRAPVADPHATPRATVAASDTTQRDLAAFYTLGRELATPRPPREVAQAIWTSLRAEIGASACAVFIRDPRTDALAPLFWAGTDGLSECTRIPVGERLSGWVAATGTPILNSDPRLDFEVEARDRSPLQSALAVPIVAGEHIDGVLAFYSERPAAFSAVQQRVAEAVAAIVAARIGTTRAEGSHPMLV